MSNIVNILWLRLHEDFYSFNLSFLNTKILSNCLCFKPLKNGYFTTLLCYISVSKIPIKCYHFRRDFCTPILNASRFLINFGPWFSSDPLQALNHAGDPFISRALLLGVVSTESYLDLNAHQVQFGFEEDQRNKILR